MDIYAESERLADASSWPGCAGGWQYPFDLGNGKKVRPYGPVQEVLHPWRRRVLLDNLDPLYAGRYGGISVLDLGSCEGGMAEGLWLRGVRDITCVESRAINIEKARFIASVKNYGFKIIQAEVSDYLRHDTRTYDVVLFMGILYHLLDPFSICRAVAARTRTVAVYETVLAMSGEIAFANPPAYGPEPAGFFVRRDCSAVNTAGLRDIELWPNRAGFELLLRESGFREFGECRYGNEPLAEFATGQRTMYLAFT